MPGLSFLSKKSWHTSNLNNQEKVWLAEQNTVAEEAKTRELSRQLQQEREVDEIHKLAGKSIHSKDRLDRGIDWMYTSGASSAADVELRKKEQAEEYLLGKEFNPTNAKSGDFAMASAASTGATATTGIDHVIHSYTPSSSSSLKLVEAHKSRDLSASEDKGKVLDWNESFSRRYEDPMYMVEQKRIERETEFKKRQLLLQRVTHSNTAIELKKNDTSVRDTHSLRKQDQNNSYETTTSANRQHKSTTASSEELSSSSSSTSSSSYKRHKKRKNSKKSSKRHHKKRKHCKHHDDDEDDGFNKHDNLNSDTEKHQKKRKHKERKQSFDKSKEDALTLHRRSSNDDNHRSYGHQHQHRHHKHDYMSYKNDHDTSYETNTSQPNHEHQHQQKMDHRHGQKMDGYGLQQKHKTKHNDTNFNHHHGSVTTHLGPDETILQRKRKEIQEKRSLLLNTSRSNNTSHEDKEIARQQMQVDAIKRIEDLSQKVSIPSHKNIVNH